MSLHIPKRHLCLPQPRNVLRIPLRLLFHLPPRQTLGLPYIPLCRLPLDLLCGLPPRQLIRIFSHCTFWLLQRLFRFLISRFVLCLQMDIFRIDSKCNFVNNSQNDVRDLILHSPLRFRNQQTVLVCFLSTMNPPFPFPFNPSLLFSFPLSLRLLLASFNFPLSLRLRLASFSFPLSLLLRLACFSFCFRLGISLNFSLCFQSGILLSFPMGPCFCLSLCLQFCFLSFSTRFFCLPCLPFHFFIPGVLFLLSLEPVHNFLEDAAGLLQLRNGWSLRKPCQRSPKLANSSSFAKEKC
mmetsp:Transcript_88957/g.237219  ORF Transcript_88957/g.237219 Transcript_88957/m.237219 type:complete len:296 (-) Transcript_88957:830-1717(-)